MLHRIAMLMVAAVAVGLLWALPAAAQDQDSGYTPPEPPEPTFFEVPPPKSEPPDEAPDTTTDEPPDTTQDGPPVVPPGPPPPDGPPDVPPDTTVDGPPDTTVDGPPDAPDLPATGFEVTNGMAAAGIFLLGGTGMVFAARHRRRKQE